MAHGYLEDGYGTHGEIDPDRDEHRDRDWRERSWRGRDDWRDRDRERDRGMMFGARERGWSGEDRWSGRGAGDYSEGRRSFSAHPDDHYRSWRDRQLSELDRDYQDYCRERETQFHREFDDWRRQKYGNPQPLRTGMTESGLSQDPTGATQATDDATGATTPSGSDPMAAATLGTNSSGRGRGKG